MNLRFILLPLHSTLVTVVQIKYALLPTLHRHHLKSANPRLPSSSPSLTAALRPPLRSIRV